METNRVRLTGNGASGNLQEWFVQEREANESRPAICKPADVATALGKSRIGKVQEHFWILLLDSALKVVRVVTISKGLVDRTLVHPREVFRPAIVANCAAIIVAHNHPSGSLEPSQADLDTTNRLVKAGEIIGIQVLDHVIVSRCGYLSLTDAGKM